MTISFKPFAQAAAPAHAQRGNISLNESRVDRILNAKTLGQAQRMGVFDRMSDWFRGGVKADRMIIAQGVERDILAGESAARRYAPSDAYDLDGTFKAKGVKVMSSELVPPGLVGMWNNKAFTKKFFNDLPPEQEDQLSSIADLELYGLPGWAINQLSLHGVLWVKDVGKLDKLPQTTLIQTLWKVLDKPMTNCYYNRPTTTIEKLLRPETWQQLDQITKN
jgi:hypothetical protein